jgi:predicted permease
VLSFTALIAVLTGLLFGLFPALGASKPNLNEALKETGRPATARLGGRGGFGVLVVAEVALSLILLVGAGLMLENIRRLLTVSLGFNPENLVTMRMSLPGGQYLEHDGDQKTLLPRAALVRRRIRERLQAVPGVALASVTDSSSPLRGCRSRLVSPATLEIAPSAEGEDAPWSCYHPVSPNHFKVLQVPLVRGRFFTEMDAANAPKVAIINESMAGREFPNDDPIGQEIIIGQWDTPDKERRRIVGIVKDVRQSAYRKPMPAMYVPYEQFPTVFQEPTSTRKNLSFIIRTKTAPSSLYPALRKAAADAASDVPVVGIETVDDVQSASMLYSRFYTWLLLTFAGIALALATAGLFGVISYSVTRRTREIGLRIALGAQRRDVLGLVMKQGLVMTLVGLAIGLGGAFALTRFLESQLHEVEPTDPATFAAACVLLAVISLLACLLPALRATKVDPMVALRHE